MNLVLEHWSFDPAIVAAAVALLLETVGYRHLAARRAAISGRGMGRRAAQAWLFAPDRRLSHMTNHLRDGGYCHLSERSFVPPSPLGDIGARPLPAFGIVRVSLGSLR